MPRPATRALTLHDLRPGLYVLFAVLAVIIAGCAYSRPPRPPTLMAYFMAGPVTGDCEEMARRSDAGDAWSLALDRLDGPGLVLYASDEVWVIEARDVPLHWTASAAGALVLTCGAARRSLQALACRDGPGLRFYVDPAQLAGWERRGSVDAGCHVEAELSGVVYRELRAVLLRPGIRASLRARDPGPYPVVVPRAR